MNRWFKIILALWGLAVASGFGALYVYGAAPGETGSPPRDLPETVPVDAGETRWTLLVFVHPRCPCTRATVAEFARLHAVHRDAIEPVLVVYHPRNEPASWSDGPLVDAAARIPGIRVRPDPGGETARAFGVRTSGHVLAYRPGGRLAFSGGLTNSRGHEGASIGRARLDALLRGDAPPGAETIDVFGCPILGSDAPESCDGAGCEP